MFFPHDVEWFLFSCHKIVTDAPKMNVIDALKHHILKTSLDILLEKFLRKVRIGPATITLYPTPGPPYLTRH